MSFSDSELYDPSRVCAMCHSRIEEKPEHPSNFLNCPICGTLLVFDSRGQLLYAAPDCLDRFLKKHRGLAVLPMAIRERIPDTLVFSEQILPLEVRPEWMTIGFVHPVEDIISKVRFVLNVNVLAVKMEQKFFNELVNPFG